jgi:hypothetical protein
VVNQTILPGMKKQIFVFGSNLAGRHGKGAALTALRKYGAIYGIGKGLQGNSYAIPTKDSDIRTLSLKTIELYVKDFLNFAVKNPDMEFILTPIGCGLAGYTPEQIAPFFKGHSDNVVLPDSFKEILK